MARHVNAGIWLAGLSLMVGCDHKTSAGAAPIPGAAATATTPAPVPSATASDEINPRLLRRFQPVGGAAPSQPADPARVALGRALFYEKRLSRDSRVACNSCHTLSKYGIDGRPTSKGVDGQLGGRNAPTVYNAATHIAQFWDGRAVTIEQQASGPILNPLEMAMPNEQAVVSAVRSVSCLHRYVRARIPRRSSADLVEEHW